MEPKDDFKVSQLTKELVAARSREDDPCMRAAGLVKQALLVALKGVKAKDAVGRIVQDACQGGMTGLLLNNQDLPRAAGLFLEAMIDLAMQRKLNPKDVVRSALMGIADMRRFVEPQVLDEMTRQIEERFPGAGAAFEAIYRAAEAEKQAIKA